MKKNFTLGAISFFVLLLWTVSCIEPFESGFKVKDSIIVVDGNLSDNLEGNYVSLRRSMPSGSATSNFSNIKDATVDLFIDGTEKVSLVHEFDGVYKFPNGFKAIEGKSYKLQFTLADGSVYSSIEQNIKKVTPIELINQRFGEDIDLFGQNVPGHRIYLNSEEPEGKGDAYYWSWKLYESEKYCASCYGGVFRYDSKGVGSCEFNQAATNGGITYDYECDGKCWRIFYSDRLNAMNDAFVDGKGIVDRLIAEIPYYNKEGAVLEIKQHAVNDQAYKYLKLLIDQNQNSGSLADTPSTALNGNIKSETDPTESIGGYFLVSSVSIVNYFLSRSDVPSSARPIGYVSGRARNLEPAAIGPPLAACYEGTYRTSIEPINWLSE